MAGRSERRARGPPRSPNVLFPARIAMTESGAASATQVMAAGESR